MLCAESTGFITPLLIANAYDSLFVVNSDDSDGSNSNSNSNYNAFSSYYTSSYNNNDSYDNDDNNKLHDINRYMMFTLIVHIVGSVGGFVRCSILSIVGERFVARIRNQLYSTLLIQEIAFYDTHKSGELTSRLTSDVTLLQLTISNFLPESILGVLKVIVSVILMFWISMKLATLTIVMVGIVFGITIPMGKILGRLSKDYQDALGNAQTYATEALGAIRTVQSFGAETCEATKYAQRIGNPDEYPFWFPIHSSKIVGETKTTTSTYVTGFYKAITTSGYHSFLLGGGFAFMYCNLWYGFHLVERNEITLGQLTAFQSYIYSVGFGLGHTATQIAKVIEGLGGSTRIFHLLDRKPLIPSTATTTTVTSTSPSSSTEDEYSKHGDTTQLNRHDDCNIGSSFTNTTLNGHQPVKRKPMVFLQGHILFQNVTFAYPSRPNIPVLEDFTLEIPANTTCAIVGTSGVGKSTIVALLRRFYDISSTLGCIQIDGIDIRDYDLSWLRSNISSVLQEPQLFGMTVRENVLYGVVNKNNHNKVVVTQEDVEDACKYANVHDFVMSWPQGYDTLVGERGIRLSGGQKQRLAIARALLTGCRILLLDEATSALDTESEHLVQEAIERATMEGRGRTVVIVAHRLSTIRRASQIVVMDERRIVDVGTHDALMNRCHKYRDLIKRQQPG